MIPSCLHIWRTPFATGVAFCAILLPSAAAREKPSANQYQSYTGFTIPASPVLPPRELHPSLWFNGADVTTLRARLSSDDFARARWAAVRKTADLNAALPEPPFAGERAELIHKYYGSISMAARAHALVSLLDESDVVRAAHQRRAVDLLLRAYDGPIFQLDSAVQGSAVDEIYRAVWLQNYAHAYDCVAAHLSPDIDAKIRARLVQEAECVHENLYRWAPGSPHNHLSKPAWGLGSMALALSSHPHAKLWLARAIEAANKNTRYFFSGDGVYREGSHYLIFSLTNFLPFLYHYRNVSGVNAFPEFQPVFEAMVQMRNSRGWLPNVADSYLRPTPTHLAAAAYRNARTSLHSTAPLAEILMWSHRSGDLAPFEEEHRESGFSYTGATLDYPLEIDELLTHDPELRATAPSSPPDVFLRSGVTCFRDGWLRRTDGQRHLLFYGVANGDNHDHEDHLSFILEAEGQMMCSDSGYSRGTYTGGERKGWYATAPAHNTLTFDGKPARDRAPNQTPASLFRSEARGLVAEEKEAVFAEDSTWRRAIFWIAGDYFAVCDRVNAGKVGSIAGFLHGGRGELTSAGSERTWRYPDDRYGRAAVLRTWMAAPGAEIVTKRGELTYIKGDYAEYPYLETKVSGQSCAWLTLLKPARASEADSFTAKDVSVAGCTALAIETHDHRCLIAAQSLPVSRMTVLDLDSDGAVALVRRDAAGRVLGYAVLEGTYLNVAGRELWRVAQRSSVARVAQ